MKFKTAFVHITTLILSFFICKIGYAGSFDGLALNSITSISALPDLKQRMQKQAKQCEPYINELDIVKVNYYGFDDKTHAGILIVHRELSQDVLEIFQLLYKARFPLDKVYPQGNHPNVTLSYNCREVAMQKGRRSQHSFGRAIDINPLVNPYVKGNIVIPEKGKPYIDRNLKAKGQVTKNSLIYKLFVQRGWDWGGEWYDVFDYQHFEKRANGEKRNPYGYD